jgi:dienelactone hydrolase
MTEPAPRPDPDAFDAFIRAQARALRATDRPPATRAVWESRRTELLRRIETAAGVTADPPGPLTPKTLGVLQRSGYSIEKLIFQSRPDIWVTANAYVPAGTTGKVPGVLVVHGHWPWARRDPVVQARCLGLVKLGFFVLAVDAFGAGERYPKPARGTYHGALFGSTLWPVGRTLLGMQAHDNRRAVDYLRSRPEVDGDRLGVTGASGGGNQTMYAGALDGRFRAVVPVCSVGTYQAYLQAACCVCEVLPGALRFTEEGDVLGLVAPRALLVINATRDEFQFSVGEAEKSLARARDIYKLYDAPDRVRHAVFESAHDYNRPMREAMYGWMLRWLRNEGDGRPVAEPAHETERPEDLACFADEQRPKEFLFPTTFATREGRRLVQRLAERLPDHREAWESTAVFMREQLRNEVFGGFPKPPKVQARLDKTDHTAGVSTTFAMLEPEPGLPLHVVLKMGALGNGRKPAWLLLHLGGKDEALRDPLADRLLRKGCAVVSADLRATGPARPANDAVAGAPDHNSAEHALWIGRPLLGQWVFDIACLLDWLAAQPALDARRFAVAGFGPAGVVALCAAGLLDDRVAAAAAVDAPVSYLTDRSYPAGFPMGLLAPGILRVGDLPQLAALAAPRRLVIAGGVSANGARLSRDQLVQSYAYTAAVYRLHGAAGNLRIAESLTADDLATSA